MSTERSVSRFFSMELNEQQFFSVILEDLLLQFPKTSIEIFLFDAQESLFPLVSSSGHFSERHANAPIDGFFNSVLYHRRPYFSNSLQRDPLYRASQGESKMDKRLVYPLMATKRIFAMIDIQGQVGAVPFGPGHLEWLQDYFAALYIPLKNLQLLVQTKNMGQMLQKTVQQMEASNKRSKTRKYFEVLLNPFCEETLVAHSKVFAKLLQQVEALAQTAQPLFVVGAAGTGKSTILNRIIEINSERQKKVVRLKSQTLLSIFNEEAGDEETSPQWVQIVQDAVAEAAGHFFIIEQLNTLPRSVQVVLLEALKQTPPGRIFATMSGEYQKIVRSRRVLQELEDYLQAAVVELPTLQERAEDMDELIHTLHRKYCKYSAAEISPDALKALKLYEWTENLRELQETIRCSVYMAGEEPLNLTHLPQKLRAHYVRLVDDRFDAWSLEAREREHILSVLKMLGGNKTKAAKLLGVTVKTLYNKLNVYGIFSE